MKMRELVLRIKGEPKGAGSCLDMPASEAMVSDPRDRPRDNCKAPQTTRLEGLPGSQMLLLEENLPWLGIWVQCFPFKEEKEGGKRQNHHCLFKNVLFLSVHFCSHRCMHTYSINECGRGTCF